MRKFYPLLILFFLSIQLAAENPLPRWFTQLRNSPGDTAAWQQLKTWYDTTSLSPTALGKFTQQALDQLAPGKNPRLEGELWRQLGISYLDQHEFKRSSDCLLRAMQMADARADAAAIADVQVNLGSLNYHLQQMPTALDYWKKALVFYEKNGPPDRTGRVLANLGAGFSEVNQYDSAHIYHRRALSIHQRSQHGKGMANAWNNLGVTFEYQENYPEAIRCYEKARALNDSLGETGDVVRADLNIAAAMEMMGHLEQAWAMNQQALQTIKTLDDYSFYRVAYLNLAGLSEKMLRYKDAFEYLQLYHIYRDSLVSQENTEYLQELQTRYEMEQKDLEIAQQEAWLDRQRILLLGAALLVSLLALLAWQIARGRRQANRLLANILPAETIRELKSQGLVKARRYESVSVLFTDFKGFTRVSEQLPPEQLVADLDHCFRAFDTIVARYPVEKIKTVGDSYMCAAGLPLPNPRHAHALVQVALEMQDFMQDFNTRRRAESLPQLPMRVGIHSGPVVAGIVGQQKFAYDIWGDTVNTAARMESSGAPDQVNISAATYALLQDEFACTPRGMVDVKGKRSMEMYFVQG